MELIELNREEYSKLLKNPFTVFDSIEFSELNKNKVESLTYACFYNGKNRFGLTFGIRDGVLLAPFSAPYACFSSITKNNKVEAYSEACEILVKYARKKGLKKVKLTLPPLVYDNDHITKLYNSLYTCGFKIIGCDINYHYDLCDFNENYISNIVPQARQKLKNALANNLVFEKTNDIELAYRIIRQNREAKGYPLWMSLNDIYKTIQVVRADFFIVYDQEANPIASSMVYHVTDEHVQVIYWGNISNTDHLRPMNFISFKTFEYYKKFNIKFVDIGPSTEFSIPNLGLCDFKQSIGCNTSPKFTFEMDI